MQGQPDLTICTVSFHSKPYLDLNWQLTSQLNSRGRFSWLVAENSPYSSDKRLQENNDKFKIVPGAKYQHRDRGPASYHHAAGLNNTLPYVKTRFVLFLDPDFYVVKRQWIAEVVLHMQKNNLSFFGVPWHPKWFVKYRYFPCVHCLFVDLDKVDIQDLDFTPECEEDTVQRGMRRWNESVPCPAGIKKFMPAKMRRFVKSAVAAVPFPDSLKLEYRRMVGSSRDTGYRIYRQHSRGHLHESAVPVFRPNRDFSVELTGPAYAGSWTSKLAEKLLPDHLCYVPKRSGYYTEKGFGDLGYIDVSCLLWEEFIWQGKPFGFHIRSYPKRHIEVESQLVHLQKAIESLKHQQL